MSNRSSTADQAAADLQRRRKITSTATIITMVLGIGVLALLSSMVSFAMGTSPEPEVLRRGTVAIDQCRTDPVQLGTAQVCTGTVVAWEPEENWVKGSLDFPTNPSVAVLSRTPLSGEVAVESHRKSWRSGPSRSATLIQDEVLVPEGQFTPSGAGVAVGTVLAVIVIPIGLGLLVSWVGTRRANTRYLRATGTARR